MSFVYRRLSLEVVRAIGCALVALFKRDDKRRAVGKPEYKWKVIACFDKSWLVVQPYVCYSSLLLASFNDASG